MPNFNPDRIPLWLRIAELERDNKTLRTDFASLKSAFLTYLATTRDPILGITGLSPSHPYNSGL